MTDMAQGAPAPSVEELPNKTKELYLSLVVFQAGLAAWSFTINRMGSLCARGQPVEELAENMHTRIEYQAIAELPRR
jgi:hypothetical protein